MTRSITLFSSFSPDLGGGGTNLRSLIPELRGVDVTWLYTAGRPATFPGSIQVGPPMAGGSIWHDLSRCVALWSGVPTLGLRQVLSALRARGTDRYWVVGANEGILVARALAREGARVHLTIQDDVPDGVFGRSHRYRFLPPLVRPTFETTLRRVASVDVTSDGMQAYYRQRLGLSSVVVHPFVAELPPPAPGRPSDGELAVGHIGSIYATDEWRSFVRALEATAKKSGRTAKMIMIGLAPKFRPAAAELAGTVEIVDDLPEAEAVRRLAGCHFLYAMYPFEPRSEVFRRTSLPTKISSYLKCRRPIFAHSPAGSTLIDIVERHGLGVACTSTASAALEERIAACAALRLPDESYERARSETYGTGNVERLAACLLAL
jgi:hypothetical protein